MTPSTREKSSSFPLPAACLNFSRRTCNWGIPFGRRTESTCLYWEPSPTTWKLPIGGCLPATAEEVCEQERLEFSMTRASQLLIFRHEPCSGLETTSSSQADRATVSTLGQSTSRQGCGMSEE